MNLSSFVENLEGNSSIQPLYSYTHFSFNITYSTSSTSSTSSNKSVFLTKNISYDDNSAREITFDLLFGENSSEVPVNNLVFLQLPDNDAVITIGFQAFNQCKNLETVIIPTSVQSIRGKAFKQCNNLVNVILPSDSLYGSADNQFRDISKDITDTQYYIYNTDDQFYKGKLKNNNHIKKDGDNSYSIESIVNLNLLGITLEGLISAGYSYNSKIVYRKNSFSGQFVNHYTKNISASFQLIKEQDVSIEKNDLTSITLEGFRTIEQEGFKGCINLEKVVMDPSFTSLKNNCFENCSGLEQIIIPRSVKNIGENAFRGCSNLGKILYDISGSTMGINSFENIKMNPDIYLFIETQK